MRRLSYRALIVVMLLGFCVANFDVFRGTIARNAGFIFTNHMLSKPHSNSKTLGLLNQRAYKFLSLATKSNSNNASTWRRVGYLLLSQGRDEEAVHAWRQVDTMIEELLANGVAAETAADSEQAIKWYSLATALDQKSVEAWLHLGLLHEKMQDWTTAVFIYEQGLSYLPEDSELLYRIARLNYQNGNRSEILPLLDRAIASDRYIHDWSRIQTHLLRGDIKREFGKSKEAMMEYQWVLTHRPNHYWATLGLAELSWKEDKDFEKAEQLLRTAISIDSESKWAYRLLAELNVHLGQLDEARKLYELVLQIDPADHVANQWLLQQ